VNLEEGKWFCHNPGCSNFGSVAGTEVNKADNLFDWVQEAAELPAYDPEDFPLTDEVVAWFSNRGISEDTLTANRIGAGENEQGQPYITYPYFLGEQVVKVKFRGLEDKRFWQSPGGKKTLYGIDDLYDDAGKLNTNSVIIVEGENDKLAMNEAGFWAVLSVPDGAPSPDKARNLARKFDYLEDEDIATLFEQLDEVIFATDADEPGQFLAEEFARRIGYHKSFRVQFPEDTKDANEVLLQYGPDKLSDIITARRSFPVEGTFEVADFRGEIRRLYEEGFQPGLSSGYPGWDEIATFEFGRLNIWTGSPGSGKSEFLDSLNVQMAKLHDLRVGIFSPEAYPPEKHFRRLAQKVTGKHFGKPGDTDRMTLEELAYAERWVQERIKWIQPKNPTPDRVIEAARALVLRDGLQVVTLDPFNNMQHNPGSNVTFDQYISQTVDKFREFARQYKVILNLVVHPRKLEKRQDGEYAVASAYDLKGASEWFDKADNIFSIWRSIITPKTLPVEVHQQKGKDNEIVKPGSIALFKYDWWTTSYKWLENVGEAVDAYRTEKSNEF
jgi:twinkle protein